MKKMDVQGHLVGHFLAGKFAAGEKATRFLACLKPLDSTDGKSTDYFVNQSLRVLYLSGVEDNIFFLCVDTATYMHEAVFLLDALYPQMVHFTCKACVFTIFVKNSGNISKMLVNLSLLSWLGFWKHLPTWGRSKRCCRKTIIACWPT